MEGRYDGGIVLVGGRGSLLFAMIDDDDEEDAATRYPFAWI